MSGKEVTQSNRMAVIYSIAKGDADKAIRLQKLSNTELQELLANPEKIDKTINPQESPLLNFLTGSPSKTDSKNNIFTGNIENRNFDSMDGLQVEKTTYAAQTAPVSQSREVSEKKVEQNTNTNNTENSRELTDEELMQKWEELPQYVKDLYTTYLDNLSEAERIEAEKGFLDKLRDFFTQGFKLSAYTNNPGMMLVDGEAWEQGVKDALTNDVQKKLKNDEKNIKQLANLSLNFEENIDEIKNILKDILGIEVTDDEIRANKDKLLQIAELSQNFDANLGQITEIFKEMTGLDVLEEDLLKNKENIDKLNQKSSELENQYQDIKNKYKEITGKELSDEEFEKLLNGEKEIDNEEFNQLIQDYLQGYEEFADIASDVVSGVASFGAFCGATIAAGPAAGYAAAVATGAGIKYGMKKANAANKSEGYTTAAADLFSGGIGGLFNAIAPTVGSAATRAVFNRGGAKLLEKVALKSSNKALPEFINKAVSFDNQYLGASTAQKYAARYMQSAVEGVTSITPYNIVEELTADEADKQGWSNVVTNSLLGGAIFGPVMDLGFRAIGKGFSKFIPEGGNVSEIIPGIQAGSPASAAAYKNIQQISDNTFNVNIGGKNVSVTIDKSHLPADPAYIYATACKQSGINTKEEMLKTLGLKEFTLPDDPQKLNSFVANSRQYDDMILSATDGQNTYSVKVNGDGTVTLSTVTGSDSNNYAVNTITMSVEEFTQNYKISGYLRETLPEYLTDKKLDRMADKKNILIQRSANDETSKEVILESIDPETQTVTIKIISSDINGNCKVQTRQMSYDDFINKVQSGETVERAIAKVHYIAQKYGYDEYTLREHLFKGLDVNHPVFKDEKTTVAYINDYIKTVRLTNPQGEPVFNYARYNYRTKKVESYNDLTTVKNAVAFKYANPEFSQHVDYLLNVLKNGQISQKEFRNAVKALENGYVSDTTMDWVINKGLVKNGKVDFGGLIDNTVPTGELAARRNECISKVKQIIGSERFSELQKILGDDMTKVQWEMTNGMDTNEIIRFVEDIKNISLLKRAQIDPENFFINIEGYGRNADWAKSMTQTSDYAAMLIKEGASLEEVLDAISYDTRQMDLKSGTNDIVRLEASGVLRYKHPRWAKVGAVTPYGGGSKYDVYKDRFDKLVPGKGKELHNPYPDMELTRIGFYNGETAMIHPKGEYAKAALKHVDNIYKELQQEFAGRKVTNADLPYINEKIAEMHWILAHSMPWGRGSDAIANAFVKSVYKSLNIKTYPPAKNVSFDLEAFCTELSDYKKNYAKYYSRPPEIIE